MVGGNSHIICSAQKCYNVRITHPNKGFFGFPSDPQLCETWLTNCGRKDLRLRGVLKSSGYYKLCSDHFEDKFFTDSTKTVLNRSLNPVPTIFINNVNTLLPPGIKTSTSEINLPDLAADVEDASLFCETMMDPDQLMVESELFPISYRSESLCISRDYDAETVSQALLNLEPETELHQINELCRFCMNKAPKDYLELYAETYEAREIRKICNVVMPNKVEICDGLPYKVCQQCISDLRTCHRLLEQFKHADQYLRAIAKYSLYIDSQDNVSSLWEEKADSLKEFVKPLPKKATVIPLKHFRPVIEGFKGYVEDAKPKTTTSKSTDLAEKTDIFKEFIKPSPKNTTVIIPLKYFKPVVKGFKGYVEDAKPKTTSSKSTDLNSCTSRWTKKPDENFDGIEADVEPIIIKSTDNDTSVSHILKNFPLQSTELDLSSEPNIWEDDIDLICSNVEKIPVKKLFSPEPINIEQSEYEIQLVTTSLGANEDSNHSLVSHNNTNYLSTSGNKSQEHFNISESEIVDKNVSNSIKEINFEINLMNVKSVKNEPGLTVSYKCLQCSNLFPMYSELVDHVIDVHQIKPLPSPFTCEECAMQFNTDALLMQHIREQHLANKLQCSLCPDLEEFKSKASLSRHKREVHSVKCNKCGKLYDSQEKLDKHMLSKHDDRLVCSFCSKILSSVQGRKMHELTHTDRSEMCWVCGLVVKSSYGLQQHMQGHGDQTYPCDECHKLFPSPLYLRRHKKTHLAKQRRFICHICPKRFYKKVTLDKHLIAHSQGRIFMCYFCGRGFKQNEKLNLHEAAREALGGTCPDINMPLSLYKYKHTEKKEDTLECDVCGRKFMKAYNARRHRRYHFCEGNPEVVQKLLDEPEEYKCDTCGKRCYTKHAVQFHMATKHTGVAKPFTCEFCPKRFRTRPQITKHERVHSGERRYACSQCGKRFRDKEHLQYHKTVHLEHKTHICPLCGAAFRSRNCLMVHTFNHKDAESVRPFKCLHCGNRFTSEAILKAHMTKNHSADSLLQNENDQAQGGGYPCSVCGKSLVSLAARNKHVRRMHRNMPVKKEAITTQDDENPSK